MDGIFVSVFVSLHLSLYLYISHIRIRITERVFRRDTLEDIHLEASRLYWLLFLASERLTRLERGDTLGRDNLNDINSVPRFSLRCEYNNQRRDYLLCSFRAHYSLEMSRIRGPPNIINTHDTLVVHNFSHGSLPSFT